MNGSSEQQLFSHKIAESDLKLTYKDAVYISPHKFVGGPGSSGILVAKKKLLLSRTPHRVGGGPVFFVNDPVRYMSFMQDINSDRFFNKLHIPFATFSTLGILYSSFFAPP